MDAPTETTIVVGSDVVCARGASYHESESDYPLELSAALQARLDVDVRAFLRQATPGDSFKLTLRAVARRGA
jgi:hypothetical protein